MKGKGCLYFNQTERVRTISYHNHCANRPTKRVSFMNQYEDPALPWMAKTRVTGKKFKTVVYTEPEQSQTERTSARATNIEKDEVPSPRSAQSAGGENFANEIKWSKWNMEKSSKAVSSLRKRRLTFFGDMYDSFTEKLSSDLGFEVWGGVCDTRGRRQLQQTEQSVERWRDI